MKFSQVLMTIAVFLLVILGLNVSNQGINNLTLDERGAILAFGLNRSDISLQILGNNYTYPRDKLSQLNHRMAGWGKKVYREVYAFPAHYRAVLDAVLGPESGGDGRHD